MSQLAALSHTIVDKTPLKRRIKEIMMVKGLHYTIAAMARRIGIHHETLRVMINGDREIYNFELEKIANDLRLSKERITQEDIQKKAKMLQFLLADKFSLDEALLLATELLSVANGLTEKCNALNNLARVHFYLGNYEMSNTIWLEAYSIAEKISTKFEDKSRLFIILSNLMALYTARKQYSHLEQVLKQIDGVFDDQPEKMGSIYFSKAMLCEHSGNMEQAGEFLYRALECLRVSGHENKIGRAEQNVAYFEFKQRNYTAAKELLENAIAHLQSDESIKYITIKEYAKVLIKLNEMEKATNEIERVIGRVKNTDLLGKLYLLLSISKGDPVIAEKALSLDLSDKVKRLIGKQLMQHYYKCGDSDSLMRYYGIVTSLKHDNADIMHEEDL